MPVTVTARFNLPSFGTKQVKKAKKKVAQAPKKVAQKLPKLPKLPKPSFPGSKKTSPKKSAAKSSSGTQRSGGVGYRRFEGQPLWLPNTNRPDWLDGSLPGDRGFDPLGLAKPAEYLQVDIDELDQNKAVNKAGGIIGSFQSRKEQLSPTESLAPYSEVFGLQRFRECELIHGRWAMLACLGCIVAEAATGVSWVEAGKVELDGASYFGFGLPFTITQLVWIEVILVGGAEIYRNTEKDLEKRIYPGGIFDPLGLASSDKGSRLKESEIKHARLAMMAFLGYGVQALAFGEGALGSLALFAQNL